MARQFALRKYAALLMLVLRFVGVVQGVGFRPIVYRIATELGLCGGVYNDNGDAVIVIDCPRLPKPIPSRHKARFVRVYPCVVIDSSTKASLLPTRALIFLNALLCALPQLAHITHITIYPLHLALRALPSLAQIDSRTFYHLIALRAKAHSLSLVIARLVKIAYGRFSHLLRVFTIIIYVLAQIVAQDIASLTPCPMIESAQV